MKNNNSSASDSAVSQNWGGVRKGYDRKEKAHGKCYTFRSIPEVDAILSAYEGNKTEFINQAVFHFARLAHGINDLCCAVSLEEDWHHSRNGL